ncbi:MAG TPA: hypothetical protein VL400_15875 [Polyangiaceae bacterium]|jgi:hypothetical protein|nr:hypothetical protein [Polyangiaceae bacterium]
MASRGQRASKLGHAVASLTWVIWGCSGGPVIVDAPTVAAADDQQATCKVAKDPLNPMIIEWPGTSKVDFDVRSQDGVVAVSYAGCTLKVLPGCNIGGRYAMRVVTPARDRIAMENATDLYARLPLGAASLKGELSSGATLQLDYVAVGQRVAEGDPGAERRGECTGATHFVRSITVGAYSLDAMATGAAGGGLEVTGVGAGARHSEAVKHVRGSGDVDRCSATPEADGCNAVIQLSLSPLPGTATAAGAAAPGPDAAPPTSNPTGVSVAPPPSTGEMVHVPAGRQHKCAGYTGSDYACALR